MTVIAIVAGILVTLFTAALLSWRMKGIEEEMVQLRRELIRKGLLSDHPDPRWVDPPADVRIDETVELSALMDKVQTTVMPAIRRDEPWPPIARRSNRDGWQRDDAALRQDRQWIWGDR